MSLRAIQGLSGVVGNMGSVDLTVNSGNLAPGRWASASTVRHSHRFPPRIGEREPLRNAVYKLWSLTGVNRRLTFFIDKRLSREHGAQLVHRPRQIFLLDDQRRRQPDHVIVGLLAQHAESFSRSHRTRAGTISSMPISSPRPRPP